MIPTDGPLPPVALNGGLSLTVLSPGRSQLGKLRPSWAKVVRAAGLDPAVAAGPPTAIPGWESFGPVDVPRLADTTSTPDKAIANGSSIALLAEYGAKDDTQSVLLGGDAHPDVLEESIARLRDERGIDRLQVDLFKLPHNGSQGNVSRRILEQVDCHAYLFRRTAHILGTRTVRRSPVSSSTEESGRASSSIIGRTTIASGTTPS
jgi:hypothetical protein